MVDREKVLRAIEHHANSCYYRGSMCPYAGDMPDCIRRMFADASELLKEPEPVPVEVHKKTEWCCHYVSCPDCGTEWMVRAYRTHYCPNCGRRVFWEVDADGRA